MKNLRLLTVAQIVERTGLPRTTVYDLINAGRLPAVAGVSANSPKRVPEVVVEQWIEQAMKTAPAAPIGNRDADDALPPVEHPAFS